jgi:mRNA interferase MazF
VARVLRGAIHWADLGTTRGRDQRGRRPVLVVSHDVFNQRSGTVIALAITGQPQRAGYPLSWPVPQGVLSKKSWVKISQVRTLSTERLSTRVARLDESEVREIVDGLLELIG